MSDILHNNNGKDYKIIETRDVYTLLEQLEGVAYEPYVVAYDVRARKDGSNGWWRKGRYFETLEDARDAFDELTTFN